MRIDEPRDGRLAAWPPLAGGVAAPAARPAQGPLTILAIDADSAFVETTAAHLQRHGYRVQHAPTGDAGLALLDRIRVELVLLELLLPDQDGLALCHDLATRHGLPVIVCSATRRQGDRTLALTLGADAFIAKPVTPVDVAAHVGAVVRRLARGAGAPAVAEQRVEVGPLALDLARRRVTLGGDRLSLTRTEYLLLRVLATRADQVLSRDELAQAAMRHTPGGATSSLDVHLSRLRHKLSRNGLPSPQVRCVRGQGYALRSAP